MRQLEKELSDKELRLWAIRCLTVVLADIDRLDWDEESTLQDKVQWQAGSIGFKPGNAKRIADRILTL